VAQPPTSLVISHFRFGFSSYWGTPIYGNPHIDTADQSASRKLHYHYRMNDHTMGIGMSQKGRASQLFALFLKGPDFLPHIKRGIPTVPISMGKMLTDHYTYFEVPLF